LGLEQLRKNFAIFAGVLISGRSERRGRAAHVSKRREGWREGGREGERDEKRLSKSHAVFIGRRSERRRHEAHKVEKKGEKKGKGGREGRLTARHHHRRRQWKSQCS
jgi:hypothetical protein